MPTNPKLEIVNKARAALGDILKSCNLCPHRCGVDRTSGSLGYCRAGIRPIIYSYTSHHGEEPPVSGVKGSGTIFFSHCTMRCVYCQNYYFSQLDKGKETTIDELARIMVSLQNIGCHNINLVSPTHYIPQILEALALALKAGLTIPLVFNSSGYELPDTIKLLDGIADVYLPDMRYADNAMAVKYSDAPRYVEYNRESVKEMYRQAGLLKLDKDGIAEKGTIIRLLVLPGKISGTEESLRFISGAIGTDIHLSIMSQYYPTFKAYTYNEISRGITSEEYKNVVDAAHLLGLNNGWTQESPRDFDPKFFGTNISERP